MSPKNKTAEQWLQQAHGLLATNLDGALSCVERALELEPASAKAWFYKASVFHHARRPADALEAFRKCADLDGGTAPAINGVVVSLKRLGRLGEALAAADACPDRSHFNLRSGRADVFKDMGDVPRALAELLVLEPIATTDAEKGLFWYNRACYECLLQRVDDSLVSLAKAVQLTAKYRQSAPKDPDFAAILQDPRFRALTA